MQLDVMKWMIIKKRTGISVHILLNGEDVSDGAVGADDEAGWVAHFERDENGQVIFDIETQQPHVLRRFGTVTFQPREGWREALSR